MKVWIEERSDWFVLPVFKSQMIHLLQEWYPGDNSFKRMSCRQLRAIICAYVKRQARKTQYQPPAEQVIAAR